MPPKPDSRAADAMNAFVRDALQRRRGAPPAAEADPPAETPARVPSIDAGVTLSARPEPDMNAWIRGALDRRS